MKLNVAEAVCLLLETYLAGHRANDGREHKEIPCHGGRLVQFDHIVVEG
jgi:urease gamma subunit